MNEYRSIELSIRKGCPVRCSYCPQSVYAKADRGKKTVLSPEDLKVVLENVRSSPCEVFVAGFAEPLAVDHWLELLTICDQCEWVPKVVLFTTGYKLVDEQIVTLSKLRKVRFNFHVGAMTNFDEHLKPRLAVIAQHLEHVAFRLVGAVDKETRKLLRSHHFKVLFQPITTRAGNLGVKELVKEPVTCDHMGGMKRPVVLPDGTALACTNDYGCELKIGNLIEQRWEELDFQKVVELQKSPCGAPCFRGCHLARPARALFL